MSSLSKLLADLSPSKRKLFLQQLVKEAARQANLDSQMPPMLAVSRDKQLPLSFAQERLWFLEQLEPGSPTYNMATAVRLTGSLNVAAMEQSLNQIVQRHEVLRTTFATVDGCPIQVIAPVLTVSLSEVDLRELPESKREALAQWLATEEARRPFDLEQGPLLRTILLRLSEVAHVLLLTMHHVVCDGWSVGVFIREVAVLYQAFFTGRPSPLPELPVQYADFAVWQREWLQGEVLEKQLAYWRGRLGDAPTALELPTDRPRPPVQTFRGATQSLALSRELSEALKGLSQREGVTLFMTLLAAFQILLSHHTGQEDILVGSPIANRNRSEIERLIGFFVNTLVLRTDLSGNPTFRELLNRVQEVTLGAYTHQDLPFEKLVEELQPKRDLSRTPLFQVFFNMLNLPSDHIELPQLSIEFLSWSDFDPKFDLTLYVSERDEGIHFKAVCNADLYEQDRIVEMLEQFRHLLSQIAEKPEENIANFSLVTPRAKTYLPDPTQALRSDWQEAVHTRFPRQAGRLPARLAVEDKQEAWSYKELDVRSNQLANYLRANGIQAQDVVAIYGHRSASLVWALLGVLKAGAAFLILDPAYPALRLISYLCAAKPRGWIRLEEAGTPPEALEEYVATLSCHCHLDLPRRTTAASRNLLKSYSGNAPKVSVGPGDLAYVAFTSGSTGEPKGILGTHRPLPHFLEWHSQTFGLDDSDRFSMLSGLSHDPLLRDIFTPLWLGATLYIPDPEDTRSPDRLVKWMEQKKISVAHLTPAMGQLLAEVTSKIAVASWGSTALLSLRYIFFGGDALSRHTVSRFQQLAPWVTCVNFYGATETPQAMGYSVIPGQGDVFHSDEPGGRQLEVIPVGQGIGDVQLLVLNASQQLAGIGEQGEIHVRTPYLTKGYLGDDALTQERFITNPFTQTTGDQLYKTGDLGHYLPDGNVEFTGRADHQVKIRGFRVELGEVEAVLAQHPAVKEAVVRDWKDASGNKRLVAYVVPDQAQAFAASDLRSFLKKRLPNYMIPSAYTFLDALPLTPSGKVDRQALPVPDTTGPELEGAFVPPSSPTEEMLAGIWAETLKIERAGVRDDFFELGGHSLLATQVISRIREVFQVELPLRSLFEAPTVAELVERIETAHQTTRRVQLPPLKPVPRGELPLSFSQESLWFLDQFEPGNPFYNLLFTIRLAGALNAAALEQALCEIVQRHESLRTTFACAEGRPVQVISPARPPILPVVDVSDLLQAERESETQRLAVQEAQRPFDLARGPLLRVGLLWLGDEDYLLILTMHHIISDGWSMGILFQEMATLYEAFSTGKPSPLPELPIQYVDFAVWQRQWLQGETLETQISYWKRQLGGSPPVLELPTDRPRPAAQTFRGAGQLLMLSQELTDTLEALSQAEGVTLFMTLLAAFKTLLYRYTGQEDIVVGTPIAGRTQTEVEGLIGFFVNTLVLRTDLSGNPTFRELLGQVREMMLDAHAHQDLPFEKLVEVLQPERSLSYTPLFQVLFILQNAPFSNPKLSGAKFSPAGIDTGIAKFDLMIDINMVEEGRRIAVGVEYNIDLFDEVKIVRMLGHFETLLKGIVTNPSQRISDLPLLTETERSQVLNEWNETQVNDLQDACVHEMFEAQAERTPDVVAVVSGEKHLTYRELNRRANQLAHYLQALGVGPEVVVGIYVERSLEMVVGALSVSKAGGAYVPLDPVYPQDWLAFVLEDAQPSVLLTQQHLTEGLPVRGAHMVCVDTDWKTIAQASQENPANRVTCDNLIYVLYTSGLTGNPKGVAIEHRSTVALLHWAKEVYSSEHLAGVLASTSMCFNPSVFELFVPLSWGGTVILAESVLHLSALPAAERVTLINAVPSAVAELLKEKRMPSSVRVVNLTGEPLRDDLVQQIYQCDAARRVCNLYNPSEDTTCSTYALVPVESKDSPSIGRPIANTQVYLLGAHLQPVPVGVPAEICIGGDGLARGYLNRPDLTAERFIPNPFSKEPGARLYSTGDLARYLPDGNIEFLGRIDHHVEIRGFRIDLGRIEMALSQHVGVREAVVLAREDVPRSKRLVAYVVPSQELAPKVSDLHDFLKHELPSYTRPSIFVLLDALPLTPNGKVDRRALPPPDKASLSGDALAQMSDKRRVSSQRDKLSAAKRALLEKRLRGELAGISSQ